jgi:CRP-like cAMP-binding protein
MKKNKEGCDLQSCFFCRLCLKEWLPALETNRKTFTVKKGEKLITEGDAVTGIYFVNEGKVKVHKKWGEDKELIIRIANKGAIFGHRGLGDLTNYPISATALEESVVCFIEINFFLTSLRVNNELLYQLVMFFADDLQLSENKMRDLAHMPVKGRVAFSLLQLEKSFGTTKDGFLDIVLSRQDLASFSGTTYETVFRIISELTEANVIKVAGKNIGLLNKDKLAYFSKEGDT